jgi:hypothetical protein
MTILLKSLSESHTFRLVCLIAIIAFAGSYVSGLDIALRQWARRLLRMRRFVKAIYTGLAIYAGNDEAWLHSVLRALLTGSLAMGILWAVFSVLFFLWKRLKGVIARKPAARSGSRSILRHGSITVLRAKRRAMLQQTGERGTQRTNCQTFWQKNTSQNPIHIPTEDQRCSRSSQDF